MLNEKEILLQLAQHKDIIENLINKLPITSVSFSNNKLRFDTVEHNSHAYSLDLNTLTYFNFRDSKYGNLIHLLSCLLNRQRDEILYEIYLSLCLKGDIIDTSNCEFSENFEYKLEYPENYEKDSLNSYKNVISDLFLKDNLWITTQCHWGIKYDFKYKRIIIPVYQDGDLVGAIGRLNKSKIENYENKYMPILAYSKSKVLFGFDEYRDLIKKTKKVILVESEKSVMKAWQMKSKIAVLAIGCNSVSRHHIERLNILGVNEIILALDKGIEDKNVLKNDLEKLSKYSNAKIIKYLDVDDCVYLNDKECFLDKTDKNIINKCFKEHLKIYKEEYNGTGKD